MNQMINSIFEQTSSDWVTLTVSFDKLTDYLITINESHQHYTNKTIAIQPGYSDIPLPPAYPPLFLQFFTLPWMENRSCVMLTDEKYDYNEQHHINQHYVCQNTSKKIITQKKNRWVLHQLGNYQATHLIATAGTTLLLNTVASQRSIQYTSPKNPL